MARKSSRFIVGLFVTVGLIIGTAAVVWLGASRYFEEGTYYVTYFDESVQGLQMDSRVKYRGVDIGKVERISVAPDQKLVEVVMKIELAGDVQKGVVTQLRAAGITGIVFIELDHRQEGGKTLQPPATFTPSHPVIPSQPSQTKLLLSSADRILERLEQVDMAGIGDQVKGTARSIEVFFSDRRLGGLMARAETTAAALEADLRRIEGILAAGKLEALLQESREGVGDGRRTLAQWQRLAEEARGLIAEVRSELATLKAGERSEQIGQIADRLDRRTKRVADDLQRTAEEVRQGVDSLRGLLERLRETPSDLIFSEPSAGAGQGEEG